MRDGRCRTVGIAGGSCRMRPNAIAPGSEIAVATANTIVAGTASMNMPANVALAMLAMDEPMRTLPMAEPRSLSG